MVLLISPTMWTRVKNRFKGPGGFREVFAIALPLILTTSAHTIQMFVDRIFLTQHDNNEMAAALPAGITSFAIASLFLGIVSYANTFVAQYTGANRPSRVGAAVWQAIILSIVASVFIACFIPLGPYIFNWMGHDASVRTHEIIYFKIMCLVPAPMLINSALSSFYTGRSKTWVVMIVNTIGVVTNIFLDYCLIFGNFGFPEMGIAGAGWATFAASIIATTILLCMFLSKTNRKLYATLSGAKLDRDLFKRLIRYGMPNGIQFMLDITGFTLFVAFVGRISPLALAATNMAFQINHLAFMPMIGLGISVSVLVGQALGKNDPKLAKRTTWSAAYMTATYMILIAGGFIFCPSVFLYPFAANNADPEQFAKIQPLAIVLLRFVAFYCLFDTGNIVFSAVLKGAGDTKFVMGIVVLLNWLIMVLPSYLAVRLQVGPHGGLYLAWASVTAYVSLLSFVFLFRFLSDKWTSMRVIEITPPSLTPVPEIPTAEIESN